MRALAVLFLLTLTMATPAFADRGNGSGTANGDNAANLDGASDQDRARSAVERDEILPLKHVLETVRQAYGGRVIEVELDLRQGRYFYELKLISEDGRIFEVEVDAASGVATDGGGKTSNEKDG